MALSASPLTAFAGDGETGDAIVEETECICETLCDEENINENCPVCSENWENCEGEEPECDCETLCDEKNINDDCPVCSAEGAELDKVCVGAAPMLPVTTLAAAPIGQVLYVGGVQISSTGYWTTDSDGNVIASTAGETPTDNYISYDAENNVLTLHNATWPAPLLPAAPT